MSMYSLEKTNEVLRNKFLRYLLKGDIQLGRLVEPFESDSFMVSTMNRLLSREPVHPVDVSSFVAEFYRYASAIKREFNTPGVGKHWKHQAYMCYSMKYTSCNNANAKIKEFFSCDDAEQLMITWLFNILKSPKYLDKTPGLAIECYKLWIAWCANEIPIWLKKRKLGHIVFLSSPPQVPVFDTRPDVMLLSGESYSLHETAKISWYLSSGSLDEHNKVLTNLCIPKQEGIKICPSSRTIVKASQFLELSPSLQQHVPFV